MTAPSPGELAPSLVFLALIVLLLARRTYTLIHGALYSPGRLFGFAAFALLFFALFAGTTLYAALGTWGWPAWLILAPYAAAVAVVALLAEPQVHRTARFEQRPDGTTYYRLPWPVPVLYLVLFTARLGIELVLFGLSSVATFSVPSSLPVDVLLVTIGFDLLYAGSVGLLLGRGFGTLRAWRDAQRAPSGSGAPSPPSPLP